LAVAGERQRAGERHVDRGRNRAVVGVHHLDAVGRVICDVQHAPPLIERDIGSVPADRNHRPEETRGPCPGGEAQPQHGNSPNGSVRIVPLSAPPHCPTSPPSVVAISPCRIISGSPEPCLATPGTRTTIW